MVVTRNGGTRGAPKDRSHTDGGPCPSPGSGLEPFSRASQWRATQLKTKTGGIVNKTIQV